jgi:hypothetical protein
MESTFVNKVAESGIITLDLEEYYPKESVAVFDLKDYLFMGLILKEKDFRTAMQQLDLEVYASKNVAVTCTADAIIPVWAYMLVASYLQPVANKVVFTTGEAINEILLLDAIKAIDVTAYTNQRVVVKGCGEVPIPASAYLCITEKLRPVVKSIMYGEPCSTVPIFKQKTSI